MKNIHIFDTTLRDGEQSAGNRLSAGEKLAIAGRLDSLGVDVIEAGFPASSPGDFEAVRLVARDVRRPVICGLTRCNPADIDAAARALAPARKARIHTGLSVSDIHIERKLKKTRAEVVAMAVRSVGLAKGLVPEVEFYAEDSGRADPVFLGEIVDAVVSAGADIVNIADTTGWCHPAEFGRLIAGIRAGIGDPRVLVSVHCHNDLGMAVANSLAGVLNGADQVECTVNGTGERAGNAALEEVVTALAVRPDLFGRATGIDRTRLTDLSKAVARAFRIPVSANKPVVGSNAFSHSSGIHADGIIKDRRTYEIIDPAEVGAGESRIVLTARSGRSALRFRMSALGYDTSAMDVEKLYGDFLRIADAKRSVTDRDLKVLAKRHAARRTGGL
jgi:2-isopropylmalate synthase